MYPCTTIQISQQLKKKLEGFKQYHRETYEDVIERLITLVPTGDEEGEYTDEFRLSWLRAHEDIRHGRVISTSEVKKRLGL